MDGLTKEIIKIEIDNLTVIPLLTAALFYLARLGWIKILICKNKLQKRLKNLPEIIFPIKDHKIDDNIVELFKKSFVCPVTRVWLKNPYLIKNGFSNNFDKNNSVNRIYYNRNLERIVSYLSTNKVIFQNNEGILKLLEEINDEKNTV